MLDNLYIKDIELGYYPIILDIISVLSILSAILVIISKNPVISVLYLIILFIIIGCYLILLGMHFLGLSYLLVYIGAIAILFLFIIMLLDIKSSELININKNSNILGFIITLMFFYPIYSIINCPPRLILNLEQVNYYTLYNIFNNISYFASNWKPLWFSPSFEGSSVPNVNYDPNSVLLVFNQNWETSVNSYSHISILGNIMYNNYFIWLLLTGFILLLALIGTIVLIAPYTKNTSTT